MDIETSAAIGHLAEEIGGLRHEFTENRSHTDIQFQSVAAQFASVRDDIRILADGFATVSAQLTDHRRHAQVLFEALRDEIRLLAEGVAAVSAKIDSLPH